MEELLAGIVFAGILALCVWGIVLSVNSDKDVKTTDEMVGRAQFVQFEGMNCIEYRSYRGGSLDCDWSSKRK